MSAVATPTKAQVRGHFALIGEPIKGSKVSLDQIVTFLYAYPATTRALAAEIGLPMGKRGRLSPEGVSAVASVVEAGE